MKHLVIGDIHDSSLYCFTNPLEPETSRGLVKQYNQELYISPIVKISFKVR